MRNRGMLATAVAVSAMLVTPAFSATIYNNLFPTNSMAVAVRPDTAPPEIEAGDDFILGSPATINGASFIGLLVPGTGSPSITQIVAEIYRVFPLDSNTVRTPNVPMRMNSPSDVAFDSRDSAGNQLTITTSVLSPSFTALNSVIPGGIHVATGGNGPITGTEIQINLTFTTPFNLPSDHYFFVPQVLTSSGQFYWLSATRPVNPAGTPFAPDLQLWTRDTALDPDWLRVGTDIVGGATPPTFNAAFSLNGTSIPEPSTVLLVMCGLALVAVKRRSVKAL